MRMVCYFSRCFIPLFRWELLRLVVSDCINAWLPPWDLFVTFRNLWVHRLRILDQSGYLFNRSCPSQVLYPFQEYASEGLLSLCLHYYKKELIAISMVMYAIFLAKTTNQPFGMVKVCRWQVSLVPAKQLTSRFGPHLGNAKGFR